MKPTRHVQLPPVGLPTKAEPTGSGTLAPIDARILAIESIVSNLEAEALGIRDALAALQGRTEELLTRLGG